MNKKSKNKDLEDFKYLIDSRNLSSEEKKKERDLLLKARELRYRNRKENEIKTAKLMQLKYKMEEYVNDAACDVGHDFPEFLRLYIDILYEKRKNFASDINVNPLVVSHVLNRHREPAETFLYRLIHHTQETYSGLCEFSWELWPKVYYRDKVCVMKKRSQQWEKSEGKQVRGKTITFFE